MRSSRNLSEKNGNFQKTFSSHQPACEINQQIHVSLAKSVAIPYIAIDIPSALPTRTEIEASKNVLSEYGSRTVVRVGAHFVVKYGQGIDIMEGENMLFVRRMTSTAIPKVYAIYTEPITRKNYIIMEHIEGDTLETRWSSLSARQKKSIVDKLERYFNELRRLPSPGYFGSLDRRPLLDDVFWTSEKVASINGPFDTEDALNEALAQEYTFDGRRTYKADFYRKALCQVFRGHNPTFTHADLRRKNIIIRPVAPNSEFPNAALEDGFEVTLIDWEKAG